MVNDDWPLQLARSLCAGRITATLEQRLDTLLIWLGNPDNHHVAELDAAIARSGLHRSEAAERAYDLLDQLLFLPGQSATGVLGLPSDTDPLKAKHRYRRLIQAYHPDRHPLRATELTDRTERINLAFRAFTDGSGAEASRPDTPTPRASRSGPWASHSHTDRTANHTRYRSAYRYDSTAASGPTLAARLRHRLGAADSFQTRFFAGLILICVLLLGSLLYFDEESAGRGSRPVGIDPSSETVAMSETTPALEASTETESIASPQPDSVPNAVAMVTATESAASSESGGIPQGLPVDGQSAWSDGLLERPASSDRISVMESPELQSASLIDTPADPQRERLRTALASAWPIMARTLAVPDPTPEPQPEPRAIPTEQISRSEVPRAASRAEPAAQTTTQPVERREPPPQPPIRSESAPPPVVADCAVVQAILVAFRRAYEAGQPGSLVALYSPAATENGTRGRAAIQALYTEWFARTSERRFSFDRVTVREPDSLHCVAMARFRVRYRDAGQRTIDRSGSIEFRFERHNSSLRILRLSY